MFEEGLTIMANLGTEGFKRGTKEIERAVRGLAASAKRFGTQITSSIRRILPMIIGVGSAYGIISKGVSAFMSENEQLSQRMSAIWTAVGNLLGPIITQIIDWVSTAVSYFISFLNLLGITNKTAADLSKKAKKNAGDLQRTIAGFDELNVLQDNNGKENPLENKEPPDWMKKLAEFIKNKEWDAIASMIINKLNEWIGIIKEKAYELGQAIGEYIGGALHILSRIVEETDWKGIGTAIAEFFRGIFDQIDGKELGSILVAKITIPFKILTGILEDGAFLSSLGRTISDVVIGAINSISNAIKDADWQTIGANIIKFFTEDIKWVEIGDAIFGLLEAAWNAAIDLLKGIITGDGDPDVEEPYILTSLRNIWNTINDIKDNIAKFAEDSWPILKKILEWGGSEEGLGPVLEGIFTALNEMIKALDSLLPYAEKFWDNILQPILTIVSREIVETLGDLAKVFQLIAQLANGEISFIEFSKGLADVVFGTDELTHTVENTKGNVEELSAALSELYQIGSDENRLAAENGLDSAQYSLREVLKAQEEYKEGLRILAEETGYSEEQLAAWAKEVDGDFTKIEALNSAIERTGPAMHSSTTAMQEGSKEYGEAIDELSKKSEEGAKVVEESTKKINETTTENTDAAATNATQNSQTMEQNTTDSFEGMKTDSVSEMEDLSTEANRIFSGLASDSYTWGADLMSNFLSGINAMIPALQSTLIGIANMVNSYIGFSKPEKGPLSDFDKYGPDMMELFAEGIKGGEGDLINALNDIADTVSVRAPGMAGGALLPYGVAAVSGGSDATTMADNSYDRLIGAIDSLESSIRNGNWVIDFGNFRMVAKEITRVQRQMARAEGV